jgi:hypothetical protein
MYIVTFNSRNFEFIALGTSVDEAQEAMIQGIEVHSKKMNLSSDWWTVDDFNIDECPIGGCVCEHSVIYSPELNSSISIVSDGKFSGRVLEVVDGIVTQKINREGNMVKHNAHVLSVPVVAGDVVEIAYVGGIGMVSGKDASLAGLER